MNLFHEFVDCECNHTRLTKRKQNTFGLIHNEYYFDKQNTQICNKSRRTHTRLYIIYKIEKQKILPLHSNENKQKQ